MGQLARRLPMQQDVRRRVVSLVAATQPQNDDAPPPVRRYVRFGSGPRGAQALVLAAKAHALVAGRSEATHEDVTAVVLPALRHRLVLNYDAAAEQVDPDAVLAQVLQKLAPR